MYAVFLVAIVINLWASAGIVDKGLNVELGGSMSRDVAQEVCESQDSPRCRELQSPARLKIVFHDGHCAAAEPSA